MLTRWMAGDQTCLNRTRLGEHKEYPAIARIQNLSSPCPRFSAVTRLCLMAVWAVRACFVVALAGERPLVTRPRTTSGDAAVETSLPDVGHQDATTAFAVPGHRGVLVCVAGPRRSPKCRCMAAEIRTRQERERGFGEITRSIDLQRFNARGDHEPKTFNAQRSTLNVQRSTFNAQLPGWNALASAASSMPPRAVMRAAEGPLRQPGSARAGSSRLSGR